MADVIKSLQFGYDCTFELDKFNEPRLTSEIEMIKNVLLTILFMKPGNYPSIPNLGMDIHNMLYSYYTDWDETDLENKIISQCNALAPYFRSGDIAVKKIKYRNQPTLLIHISTSMSDVSAISSISVDNRSKGREFFIGITIDKLNELILNINSN